MHEKSTDGMLWYRESVDHVLEGLNVPPELQHRPGGLGLMMAAWLCSEPGHTTAIAESAKMLLAGQPIRSDTVRPQLVTQLEVDVRGSVDLFSSSDGVMSLQIATGEIKADAAQVKSALCVVFVGHVFCVCCMCAMVCCLRDVL